MNSELQVDKSSVEDVEKKAFSMDTEVKTMKVDGHFQRKHVRSTIK